MPLARAGNIGFGVVYNTAERNVVLVQVGDLLGQGMRLVTVA